VITIDAVKAAWAALRAYIVENKPDKERADRLILAYHEEVAKLSDSPEGRALLTAERIVIPLTVRHHGDQVSIRDYTGGWWQQSFPRGGGAKWTADTIAYLKAKRTNP
jgi:hypothetical protein